MSFRVATFNLQFGQGWSDEDPDFGEVNFEKVIADMRSLQADVFLLQEVEFVADPLKQITPPPNLQKIQTAFPDYHIHFSYPPLDERELPFGYGQAIVSRFPLSDLYTAFLPAPDIEFDFFGKTQSPAPRVMIGAKVWIEDQAVQFYNVHLQAVFMLRGLNSDDYPEQRNIVERHLRESYLPTILGGDFNSSPRENTINQLETTGYRTVQKSEITWKRRPYVTDHLFYNDPVKLESYQVITTSSSDHNIVVGDFSLVGKFTCPPQLPSQSS